MDGESRGEGWAPGREQGGARGEGAREGVGVGSRGVGAGIDRGGGRVVYTLVTTIYYNII